MHASERIIWVEGADARGENKGSWLMNTNGSATDGYAGAIFGDSPAAFHGGTTCSFSYCDGHVAMHKWLDGTTIAYAISQDVDKDSSSKVKCGQRGCDLGRQSVSNPPQPVSDAAPA
jgi:prepilin-type processing-associated H-X9-DG protein